MKIDVPATQSHDLVLATRQESLLLDRPGGFPIGTRILILVGDRTEEKKP